MYPKEILSLSLEKYKTSVIHLQRDQKFQWWKEHLSWMHGRTVKMVKAMNRLEQPFCLTHDADIFSWTTLERPFIDLRLSQGHEDDSKLRLAQTCRGFISNRNFHCNQRCILKNRALTKMNECHKTKSQIFFHL